MSHSAAVEALWHERLALVANTVSLGTAQPLGMQVWLRQEKRKQRAGVLESEHELRLAVDAEVTWMPPVGEHGMILLCTQ